MKKVLVDTNIILRLLIGDVPEQLVRAKEVFSAIEDGKTVGLVSILVVNELVWILEYFYEKPRSEYLPLILRLFSLKNLKILEIKKAELFEILARMEKTNLDFTDIYLEWLSHERKIQLVSFDKKLIKLPVLAPRES